MVRLCSLSRSLSRLRRFSSSWTFFFSSRRRHTRCLSDWSSDVCSSDLLWHWFAAAMPQTSAVTNRLIDSNDPYLLLHARSEERRVGKECRSQMLSDQYKTSGNIQYREIRFKNSERRRSKSFYERDVANT